MFFDIFRYTYYNYNFFYFWLKNLKLKKKFFSTPPKSTQGINNIILLFIFIDNGGIYNTIKYKK